MRLLEREKMELAEVKKNLNNEVLYNNAKYKLLGCIIRRNEKGFFYQAELQDLNCRSLLICKLTDIEAIKNN